MPFNPSFLILFNSDAMRSLSGVSVECSEGEETEGESETPEESTGIISFDQATGKVKGVDDGNVTIQFMLGEHTDVQATCDVEVQSKDPGQNLWSDEENKTGGTGLALRRIICSDVAKSYKSVGEANLWGHTPIAIITYVGKEEAPADIFDYDNETEGEQNYKNLAMALVDVGTASWFGTAVVCSCHSSVGVVYGNENYSILNGIDHTNTLYNADHQHNAAIMAKGYATEIGSYVGQNSGWFLPSIAQWNLMLKNAFKTETKATDKDGTEQSSWDDNLPYWNATNNPRNTGYSADAINEKYLKPVGVSGFRALRYWSSSAATNNGNGPYAFSVHFQYATSYFTYKNGSYPIRPVFAFGK